MTKQFKILKRGMDYSMTNRLMLIIMLLAEVIIFASLTPYFFQMENLMNVGREISTLGIVAIGQTMCILTGGFDLSVGGSAAMSAVIVGYLCSPKILDLPYWIGLPAGLLVALIIGMTNGLLITKGPINPFITTMSMNFILGGAVILITKQPITVNTAAFKFLGATSIGPIPLPIIVLALAYIAFGLILKYTVFGRHQYCTGGNTMAARIAGINTKRVIFFTYSLSGLLAGFAGIMLSSRLATSNPGVGGSYGLQSIAAAVLGGTALSGGEGNMLGSFLGVLVTGILANGLVMIGVSQSWRDIATGVMLIIAVLLQLRTRDLSKPGKSVA